MTRISAQPVIRDLADIAISNRKNLEDALFKVEQRLAHIRENLATRPTGGGIRAGARVERESGEERVSTGAKIFH